VAFYAAGAILDLKPNDTTFSLVVVLPVDKGELYLLLVNLFLPTLSKPVTPVFGSAGIRIRVQNKKP